MIIKHGAIVANGTFQELQTAGLLSEFDCTPDVSPSPSSTTLTGDLKKRPVTTVHELSNSETSGDPEHVTLPTVGSSTLVADEERASGHVGLSVYWQYLRRFGWFILVITTFLGVAGQVLLAGSG